MSWNNIYSIDRASLEKKIRQKRRENALLATSVYRPFGYQFNENQDSKEIN